MSEQNSGASGSEGKIPMSPLAGPSAAKQTCPALAENSMSHQRWVFRLVRQKYWQVTGVSRRKETRDRLAFVHGRISWEKKTCSYVVIIQDERNAEWCVQVFVRKIAYRSRCRWFALPPDTEVPMTKYRCVLLVELVSMLRGSGRLPATDEVGCVWKM